MKVYISNYRNHWISPYTILEKVCFWEKDKDAFYNPKNHPNCKYEKAVNMLLPICSGIQKFLDFVHPRIEYVKIDKYDTYSMDSTLSIIILPMLKQLKETKHGAPNVDDEDVPEELRSTSAGPKENEYDVDEFHFQRWDYVLDQMIWAFEQLCDQNNEDQFQSGDIDWKSVPVEWDDDGKPTWYKMECGPNHTHHFDYEGYRKHHDKIENGTRLFGKYYRSLWD